ncbi:MAG: NAD(P)-dependent glycerol-3-phosphate dehydrogenase [Magnetococcales bacterium]|nr:NAD(P)-dependent glycerol-3-phosphate dehydrogenase [Magnetococcales bacterium]
MDPTNVAVIGGGSWGTALAALLARKLPEVTLWAREPEVAEGINSHHHNPLFIPDLSLPENLHASSDLASVVQVHRTLVVVIPTQFTRSILKEIRNLADPETHFISASKGIEVERLTLISEMYDEVFGPEVAHRVCFLSGPSFARDVIAGQPAAVAVAGRDADTTEAVQNLFSSPQFRAYRTDDVVGVELGGALKNVIALAAGISDGLGFGHSARAALITRGLAEIIRLGARLGGRPETFAGLSGLGDLLLTATSDLSRNRVVGVRLGSGETLAEIQQGTREVAEGVKTALSVHHLSQKLGVDMPISAAVYEILYEEREPRSVVSELMRRGLRAESDWKGRPRG